MYVRIVEADITQLFICLRMYVEISIMNTFRIFIK